MPELLSTPISLGMEQFLRIDSAGTSVFSTRAACSTYTPLIKWGWDLKSVTYYNDKQVHEQMGEVNKPNGLQRERPSRVELGWAGLSPEWFRHPPQNGCLLGWLSRIIKNLINRMDFQVSNILPGSWIFSSLFLQQVRHACWSNSSIYKCGSINSL